jgi:hypothetical protein
MKRKPIFALLVCIGIAIRLFSQCTISFQITNITCCGSCNGSIKAFPAGGSPPYTYSWSPSSQTTQIVTGLCQGSYTCVVTDNVGVSCIGFASIMGPFTSLTITTMDASCSTCCDGTASANVSGGFPPYSYSWSTSPSQTTQTATGLCPGVYWVVVSDSAGGCCVVGDTINSSVGLNEIENSPSLTIFPNPSSGIFHLELEAEADHLEVLNAIGELIFSEGPKGRTATIDLSLYPDGLYLGRILTKNGTGNSRLILQH